MKKLFFKAFIAILSLFSVRSFASELTLRMSDNSVYNISFDADIYNDISGNILLQNVSPGKHYLKVLKYRVSPNGYVFGLPRLIFEGMIHMRSGRAVFAVIDDYGRYMVEDEFVLSPVPYCPPPPVYIPPYMNDLDFSGLKASIDRLSFDSSKLSMAEQAASSNVLTSVQVFEIMELFSFESTKLSFAKHAYHFVYDPNKYYIVNNAFTFSSSIESLNSYISHP